MEKQPHSGKDFERRVEAATFFPILVGKTADGTLVILDGYHRAIKARRLGKTSLKGYVVSIEDLLELPDLRT